MESSEELRHVVTRFFEALRDRDEEAVRNLEGLQLVNPLAVEG